MNQKIQAIYEGGVFKPLSKISLPERETVELTIKRLDGQSTAAATRGIIKIDGETARELIESDEFGLWES